MGNVSTVANSNTYMDCKQVSIKRVSYRYKVYLRLVTLSVMTLVFGLGTTESSTENVTDQATEICDRTEEVVDAIVSATQETRPDATCSVV